MSKPRACLKTSRGVLFTKDPSITITDLEESYLGGVTSQRMTVQCLLKYRPDLLQEVVNYSIIHGLPHDTDKQAIVNFFNKITEVPKCKVCGKLTTFQPSLYRYGVFCCRKCRAKDEDVKKKWLATVQDKYGTDNPAKNDAVKAKLKSTVQARYGTNCYLATDEGKAKSRDTVLKKYGVEHVMMIKAVRDKRDATMLKRYGTIHALQNKELYKLRDNSCLNKYGVLYPGASKLKEIVEEQRLELYDKLPTTFPNYTIQCTKQDFLGVYEHENTWKCNSCGYVFTRQGAPFCHCQLCWRKQVEVFEFVRTLCPDAIARDHEVLHGKELDIYVPSAKLAFEYNGLYWHSERCGKHKQYHLTKTVEAAKAGVRLIHIFEDEWLHKREIVEDTIKSLLGLKKSTIYARNCVTMEISNTVANEFLNKYHILGSTNSSVHIGLMHNGTLVALGSFKHISKSNNSWYLERYAAVQGERVQGGCGKILAYFKAKYNPSLIRTFADLRWSIGNMYTKLGFTEVKRTGPIYWYVKHGGSERIHRFNLRKHKKHMFTKVYDVSMTESQLAMHNGYDKVWDCGQIVYELK